MTDHAATGPSDASLPAPSAAGGAGPDVSVIVPAWRAADTLAACARTALGQEGVTVELVIVDDASPDGTFAAAQALAAKDPRIRALRLGANGGPGAARNAAIAAARGTWIAVLDADDGMRPDRLAGMVALADRVGADVVLGNLAEVDETGAPLRAAPFLAAPDRPEEWDMEGFVAGNMQAAGGQSLGYLKPLIRRTFLADHGIRYDPALRNGEDFHLILAAFAAGARVWFDPAPGYLYTRRPGSLSHRADPAHMLALIRADRAFAERHRGSSRLQALLRDRRRGLADVHAAEVFLGAVRNARPGAALRALAARPRAAGRIARQLQEAVAKRLGRRGGKAARAERGG